MWHRMEVWRMIHKEWWGFVNGLYYEACSHRRDKDYIGSPDCFLGTPPHDVWDRRPLCWANDRGWGIMDKNLEKAIGLCAHYDIPYRILESEQPGELVWEDAEQGLFVPPAVDQTVVAIQQAVEPVYMFTVS
jgi:hypothetical protein